MVMNYKVREGIWIQIFLNKPLRRQVVRRIEMLEDNKISLTLIKDLESQNNTKPIDIIYYHIQGPMEDRELGIE